MTDLILCLTALVLFVFSLAIYRRAASLQSPYLQRIELLERRLAQTERELMAARLKLIQATVVKTENPLRKG